MKTLILYILTLAFTFPTFGEEPSCTINGTEIVFINGVDNLSSDVRDSINRN